MKNVKRVLSVVLVCCLMAGMVLLSVEAKDSITSIPGDAVEFNGHYYKLYNNSLSWRTTKSNCEELGGHLVTITSEEEQLFLTNLVSTATKKNVWIGGYPDNGVSTWITGEDFCYTNWATGEPNNVFNMQNAYMMYTSKATYPAGQWNDENENGRSWTGYYLSDFGYICEWDNGTGPGTSPSIKEVGITLPVDEAKEFLGFLYNKNTDDITEEEWAEDEWLPLITGTFNGSAEEERAQKLAFLTFVDVRVGNYTEKAAANKSYFSDIFVDYLYNYWGYLDDDIVGDTFTEYDEYVSKLTGYIEDALIDAGCGLASLADIPISEDMILELQDIMSIPGTVTSSITSAADLADKVLNGFVAVLATTCGVFESEFYQRYGYFAVYLDFRPNYTSPDDKVFQSILDSQLGLFKTTSGIQEALEPILFNMIGKDPWYEHTDLFQRWGEFVYQMGQSITVRPASIEMDMTEHSLTAGDTCMLTAEILPEDTTNRTVKWKSSDPAVAIVDDQGIVTSFKAGTTTITASNYDGAVSAYCNLTVVAPAAGSYKLEATAPVFDSVTEGYAQPDAKPIVIKNTGDNIVAVYSVAVDSSDFILNKTGRTTIAAGSTDKTYTIQPKAGLGAGLYTVKITVTYNNYEIAVTNAAFIVDAGTHTGTSGGTTRPTEPTTPTGPEEPGAPVSETPMFADVPANAWFAGSVAYVVDKGLFKGTSETTFSPNDPMTRGMLMTVLARLDGQDTTPAEGQIWYAPGMDWAVENGVSDGTNLNGAITREQLATMLWRYAGEPETAGTLNAFTDAHKVSSYAETAMKWAVENGIVNGKGNGILDPKGNATRAEVSAMLMRFCEKRK